MEQLKSYVYRSIHDHQYVNLIKLIDDHKIQLNSFSIDSTDILSCLIDHSRTEYMHKMAHDKKRYIDFMNCVKDLLKRGSNDNPINKAIYCAVKNGMRDVVHLLVQNKFSVAKYDNIMFVALFDGPDYFSYEMCKTLAMYGANLNARKKNYGKETVLQEFYRYTKGRTNINYHGQKNYDKIKMLLENGIDYMIKFDEREADEVKRLEQEKKMIEERKLAELKKIEHDRKLAQEKQLADKQKIIEQLIQKIEIAEDKYIVPVNLDTDSIKNKTEAGAYLLLAIQNLDYLQKLNESIPEDLKQFIINFTSQLMIKTGQTMPDEILKQLNIPEQYTELINIKEKINVMWTKN